MSFDFSRTKEGEEILLEVDGEVTKWKHAGRDENGEIVVDGSHRFGRFPLSMLLGEPAEPKGQRRDSSPAKIDSSALRAVEDAPASQAGTPPVITQEPLPPVPPTVKPL